MKGLLLIASIILILTSIFAAIDYVGKKLNSMEINNRYDTIPQPTIKKSFRTDTKMLRRDSTRITYDSTRQKEIALRTKSH